MIRNSCFMKSRNLKKKKSRPEGYKFKMSFNIGSNWGPCLPVGRGEHVDSVPSLGKWCQGFITAEIANGEEKEEKEILFQLLKIFSKFLICFKLICSHLHNIPLLV